MFGTNVLKDCLEKRSQDVGCGAKSIKSGLMEIRRPVMAKPKRRFHKQFKALCWDALKENTDVFGGWKNNFSTTLYEFMQSIEAMEKDLLKNELTSIKD